MNQSCFNRSFAIALALRMMAAGSPAFAEAPISVTIDNCTFKPAKVLARLALQLTTLGIASPSGG